MIQLITQKSKTRMLIYYRYCIGRQFQKISSILKTKSSHLRYNNLLFYSCLHNAVEYTVQIEIKK